MLHFTSPRRCRLALSRCGAAGSPRQSILVLSSLIIHVLFPYHTRIIPVPYRTGTAPIRPCTYVTHKRERNQIRARSRVWLRKSMRILLPRNTCRKKRMETPDPNNTRMPWSVPKRAPVDVPIGKRNPWVPWLLQYFLLVPYISLCLAIYHDI